MQGQGVVFLDESWKIQIRRNGFPIWNFNFGSNLHPFSGLKVVFLGGGGYASKIGSMLWKHTCVHTSNRYITYYLLPQNTYCHSCCLLAGRSEIIQLSSWNYKLWVQVLRWWTSLSATWGMATHKVDTSCLLDCFPGWSKCSQDSGKRVFLLKRWSTKFFTRQKLESAYEAEYHNQTSSMWHIMYEFDHFGNFIVWFLIFLWIQQHIVTYSGSLDLLTTGFEE